MLNLYYFLRKRSNSVKNIVKGFLKTVRNSRVAGMATMLVVICIGFGFLGREYCEIKWENDRLREEVVVLEGAREENEILREELDRVVREFEEFKSGSVVDVVNGFKSYMGVNSLNKNSKQGKIVFSSNAYTNEDGLRMYREDGVDYYCVALGSYYGKVGDKFWVETDKGNVYRVIKADEKADKHTDATNRVTLHNGCLMEWVVEINKLDPKVRSSGNINNVPAVSGQIVRIVKIEV